MPTTKIPGEKSNNSVSGLVSFNKKVVKTGDTKILVRFRNKTTRLWFGTKTIWFGLGTITAVGTKPT